MGSEMCIRDRPYSLGLSLLGMTGLSAYFGYFSHGNPNRGETVVISGAAGGVGSTVVQFAKMLDCYVIGIAGGEEKCNFIESLGCDESIDYKSGDIENRIKEAAPNGIDLYFDNVGGDILSACMENLAIGYVKTRMNGGGANLEPEESITGMLKQIEKLDLTAKLFCQVINIPSYQVNASDEISVTDKGKDQLRVKNAVNISSQLGISEWLSVDQKKLKGIVNSIPEREDILPDIQENLVVEFYSK